MIDSIAQKSGEPLWARLFMRLDNMHKFDTGRRLSKMNNILSSDEIRANEPDLLVEFDSFCKYKGLRYSLSGGTLLGAIRHRGFIPWDDDIDVNMPRPDFDALARVLKDDGEQTFAHECVGGSESQPIFIRVNPSIWIKEKYSERPHHLWLDVKGRVALRVLSPWLYDRFMKAFDLTVKGVE